MNYQKDWLNRFILEFICSKKIMVSKKTLRDFFIFTFLVILRAKVTPSGTIIVPLKINICP